MEQQTPQYQDYQVPSRGRRKRRGRRSKRTSRRGRGRRRAPRHLNAKGGRGRRGRIKRTAPRQSMAVANPAQMAVNSAVPDSNTLLAYKLLKDSWGQGNEQLFSSMLRNEMKYLVGGISLLHNDPWMSNKMGGATMANASILAQVLKNKANEIDFEDRISPMAANILYHEYNKPGKKALAPQRIPASNLDIRANGVAGLNFTTGVPPNYGINIGDMRRDRTYFIGGNQMNDVNQHADGGLFNARGGGAYQF